MFVAAGIHHRRIQRPRSGGRAVGAHYLGYQKNGALQYAGKVGTGFTMKSTEELAKRLTKFSVAAPVLSRAETVGIGAGEWTAVHWVKPILLCEASFTEWTTQGRIRHPSFQGLREDKESFSSQEGDACGTSRQSAHG
jgi:bifunctional non-homologous end joining protein LigD